MRHSLSTRQRVIGGVLAVLAIVTVVLPAHSPAAHAEACTAGLPQRVLLSADLSFNDVQSCMDNEWVTVLRVQRGEGTRYLVEDPTDDKWKIDVRSFFDLSAFNPVEKVEQFKELLAAGKVLSEDESVQWKLAMANVGAQAQLGRSSRRANDGCKVRSRRFTAIERYTLAGWGAPSSVLPATEPSTITYAIDPSVSEAVRAIILDAIGQYAHAVDTQDAAFAYPARLVPRGPTDTSTPTITFTQVTDLPPSGGMPGTAETTPNVHAWIPGVENRWVTGDIRLTTRSDAITPYVIGHEIGHVLGLDHGPADVGAVMSSSGLPRLSQPWSTGQTEVPEHSVAFDDCMFLPAN